MKKLSIISKVFAITGALLWFISSVTMIYSSFNLCKSSITYEALFAQIKTSSLLLIIGSIAVITSIIICIIYNKKSHKQ